MRAKSLTTVGALFFTLSLAFATRSPLIAAESKPIGENQGAALTPHMQIAYQALIEVLKSLAVSDTETRPRDTARLEAQLKTLKDEAEIIHGLVKKDEKGKEHLAAELVKNTKMAHERFKLGRLDQSKFYVSDAVSTCFGCHTSRSSPVDSRFTTAFTKDINAAGLDPMAKARFLTLSRQFEAAEDAYEKILLGQQINMDELINFDPLVEYLILTLRVKNEPERALKTLNAMKKQSLPAVMQKEIAAWADTLKKNQSLPLEGNGMQKAEKLIARGRGVMEFPRDRTGVVEFILASKHLRDYLNATNISPADKAKAYYDLGLCELVLGTSYAFEEASEYFSETIRLAPKSDLAKRAYARYEENILAGYSGSSGVHLPEEEKTNLNALKKLAF